MASAAKAKFLMVLLVIALLGLLVLLDMRRRQAEEQLQQLTVRLEQLQGGNTEQNKQVAKQVVAKVRTHIVIPTDVEPTVAQIVDVQKLREKNPFYANAENGDYLIITPNRAILYSVKKDMIIDIVPVQLAPQGPQQPGAPEQQPQQPTKPAAVTSSKSSVKAAPKPVSSTPKEDPKKK